MNYLTRTEGELDLLKCSKLVLDLQQGIRSMAEAVVVGLSGGADSTLVAALSVLTLGRANVVGVHMPYNTQDHVFNTRSKDLADYLGILNYMLPIGPPVSMAEKVICYSSGEDIVLGRLSQGNLRSRMRMVYLYAICGQLAQEESANRRWRVIGTGNLSEDFIGYDTKGGDSLADFFPIGDLYKQEVYDLLDYLASIHVIKEEHIDRVPSAGLWVGQTDETELGYSYNEMAPAIQQIREWLRDGENVSQNIEDIGNEPAYNDGDQRSWQVLDFVWKRHMANSHKHMAPPVTWGRPE